MYCDWTTVGIDLSPLHGQQITVLIYNADCLPGMHYGYAYFTLESATKKLRSTNCGSSIRNVFRAPSGFSYRWNLESNPFHTLSTADSLVVTAAGTYCCLCSFNTATINGCGFVLSATAGPRYPHANFVITPLDDCNMHVRFDNHSLIATNPTHTSFTNERCEDFLWRFDDGSTSTEPSPTRTFAPGVHTVQLVAMLADGLCRDSLTQTFVCQHLDDTTIDAICSGGDYLFHGRNYNLPGTYTIVPDECHSHTLVLDTFTFFHQALDTTICEGQALVFGDSVFSEPVFITTTISHPGLCDSIFDLTLNVRPMPQQSDITMHQNCAEHSYYYLNPTDLNDTLCYFWASEPTDAPQPFINADSLIIIAPQGSTQYQLTAQYCDIPHCPITDTFDLRVLEPLKAELYVSPEHLDAERLDLKAYDRSTNAIGRHWLLDSILQECEETVLPITASLEADSIIITLIAYNSSCQDTDTRVVPIIRHSIFFPNIFTPNSTSNNLFQPIFTNISNYQLWIFDRRGDLVFHSTDPQEPWDGTHDGRPCQQGAYVYHCRYTPPDDGQKSVTGTITLLR